MKEEGKTEEKLLVDELDELDNLYSEDPEDSESDSEEEFKDEPKSDSEEEPEEKQEEKSEAKPEEKPEELPEDPKENPEDPEDPEARYNKLLDQINTLKGALTEKVIKTPEENPEDIDFLSEISMDDLGDPKILNKVFNKIIQEAVKNSSKNVPQAVDRQVNETLTAREISNQFYIDNKDLSNVRNVVKACAEQIITEHDDWKLDQILEEAAKRTRESLGISKQTSDDISDSDNAAFSKGSQGSRQKPKKVSALQQELDEL